MKYALYGILIFIIGFIVYGVFTQIKKTTSFDSKRVSCQEKTTTFENINTQQPIKKAIKIFESNNFEIDGYIDYSKFMSSNIEGKITSQDIKQRIIKIAKEFTIENSKLNTQNQLDIDFYIYENDKEDSRKKGDNCKLYAGYIVLDFLLNKKSVYKIQIDYMENDTSDLDERINCAFKSFISLKN
ncbi:MAG: hypothetical protein ACQERD_02290 [Campylobacterota bacterium]